MYNTKIVSLTLRIIKTASSSVNFYLLVAGGSMASNAVYGRPLLQTTCIICKLFTHDSYIDIVSPFCV